MKRKWVLSSLTKSNTSLINEYNFCFHLQIDFKYHIYYTLEEKSLSITKLIEYKTSLIIISWVLLNYAECL